MKKHTQGPQPEDTVGKKVKVFLSNDNHITLPIPAEEVDWNCEGDPVSHYEVVE